LTLLQAVDMATLTCSTASMLDC